MNTDQHWQRGRPASDIPEADRLHEFDPVFGVCRCCGRPACSIAIARDLSELDPTEVEVAVDNAVALAPIMGSTIKEAQR